MSETAYLFDDRSYTPGFHDLVEPDIHQYADESECGASTGVFKRVVALGAVAAIGWWGIVDIGRNDDPAEHDKTRVEAEPAPAVLPPASLEVPAKTPTVSEKLPSFQESINNLLSEISKGEGSFDSINTGVAGDTKLYGDKYFNTLGGRKLTEMTIQEVINLQTERKILAAGAYQIIRGVLAGSVKRSGIDPNRLFDEGAQRELAAELIMGGHKRPKLAQFIKGGNVSVDAALNEFCREWASAPCSNGTGAYDNDRAGNKAYGGLKRAEEFKALLIAARSSYLHEQEVVEPNTPVGNVVLVGDSLSVGYKKYGSIETVDQDFGLSVQAVDAVGGRSLAADKKDNGLKALQANRDAISGASVVVIGLGTNAVETDEQYQQGLDEAIKAIKTINKQAKIAFIEGYSYENGSKSAARRDRRNKILDEVADKYDHVFVLPVDAETLQFANDGVHLTGAGYKAATEQILSKVSQIAEA